MKPGEIKIKIQKLKLIKVILKQPSMLKILEIVQFKLVHIFISLKSMKV